jgi:hypothetical protein
VFGGAIPMLEAIWTLGFAACAEAYAIITAHAIATADVRLPMPPPNACSVAIAATRQSAQVRNNALKADHGALTVWERYALNSTGIQQDQCQTPKGQTSADQKPGHRSPAGAAVDCAKVPIAGAMRRAIEALHFRVRQDRRAAVAANREFQDRAKVAGHFDTRPVFDAARRDNAGVAKSGI